MTEQNFESMRRAMVASQLRTVGVNDPRLIAAMENVQREHFVPSEKRSISYAEAAIPLGQGRALNPPMATGLLLTEASLRSSDNVLLIGAATGYCAAVLAEIVATVVAVESDASLASQARASKIANVQIVDGPLNQGAASSAPYDVIIVDGSIEALSQALVDQLIDGGRVVAGIVEGSVTRLSRGVKAGGHVKMLSFVDANCAKLPGFEKASGFSF